MLLSLLTKEEKMKYLDLAKRLVLVDGDATEQESRLIKLMAAEMSDDDTPYERELTINDVLEETVCFFIAAEKRIRNIVYMNLFKVLVLSPVCTTNAIFLLEEIRIHFAISDQEKRDLIHIVYCERDLREQALKTVGKL